MSGPARVTVSEPPRPGRSLDVVLGIALVVVGIIGAILFGSIALALHGADVTTGDPRQAVSSAERAIGVAATTARTAAATLDTTGASASRVAAMLDQLATTMRQGSTTLRVQILGTQPFVTVADSFAVTADRAAEASTEIGSTSGGISATKDSLEALGTDLDALVLDTHALGIQADRLEGIAAWHDLAAAAAAWVAALALVVTFAGYVALRRASRPGPAVAGTTTSGTLSDGPVAQR